MTLIRLAKMMVRGMLTRPTIAIFLAIMLFPMVSAEEENQEKYVLSKVIVPDDGATAPLIEWFCHHDNSICTKFQSDNSWAQDQDEGMVWLSWHPSRGIDDPMANLDSSMRAENLRAEVPAIRVDLQPLSGIEDGADFDPKNAGLALNGTTPGAGGIVAAELPLEVTLIDINGDEIVDEIQVESDLKPLYNLSKDVVLNIALVEWHPEIWNEGIRPPHVVREWTATQAFSKREQNITHVVTGFGSEHLAAANINIDVDDANRWGIVAFLEGHISAEGDAAGGDPPPGLPSQVLAMTDMHLPTMWEGTSSSQAMPRLGFLAFSLICVIIIIITERQREHALPRITGKLFREEDGENGEHNLVAKIEVRCGKYDARIEKVAIDDPWKMRRRTDIDQVRSGSVHTFDIQIRGNPEDQVEIIVIRFSLEVETFGNWVMDLNLSIPSLTI